MYSIKNISSTATNINIGFIPAGWAPSYTVLCNALGHGSTTNTKFVFTFYAKSTAADSRLITVAKYNSTFSGQETINHTVCYPTNDPGD